MPHGRINAGLCRDSQQRKSRMTSLRVGDRVTWNSEAGYVTGRIIKIHTQDVEYKGYTHHASAESPQYEIKSDKTDHIAMHKGPALKKITS
jgi:preprotein translocase subunit YajC